MSSPLDEYKSKRDFKKTSEPQGNTSSSPEGLRFVVQRHAASRLHYDFRLEFEGVLWSWAVPKGPSLNPKDKRLAVHVEDHPLDYRNFEGTIPKGEYGGGTVQLFDEGIWIPKEDPKKGFANGSLKLELQGQRLKGGWALVRMKAKKDEQEKNWLLIKEKDDEASSDRIITDIKTSVRSNETLEEISKGHTDGSAKIETSSFKDKAKASETASDETKPNKKKPNKAKANTTKAIEAKDIKEVSDAHQTLVNRLPFENLPFKASKPMLASLKNTVPKGTQWIHELKFDGYRVLIFMENKRVRVLTRNGHDWSHKVPALIQSLEKWSPANMVLDGELVVFDEDGKTDFGALQAYLKEPKEKDLSFVAFDLLAYGNQDLRSLPLINRKDLLFEVLKNSPSGIHFSYHTKDGQDLLNKACDQSLEGIISKKKESLYHQSRSKEWIKIKCRIPQEFVIGGYTVTDINSTGLSALLLGVYEDQDLIYRGRAGTGFSKEVTTELLNSFNNLNRKTSPFVNPPSQRHDETIHHLSPKLVAQVEYTEMTNDNLLRQASYQGLRIGDSVREVQKEFSRPDKPTKTINNASLDQIDPGQTSFILKDANAKSKLKVKQKSEPVKNTQYGNVSLSSPDKLLFPEDNITKQDVADYYWAIQERMMPHLSNRPVTFISCTDKIGEDCFYQKHLNHEIDGINSLAIKDNDGEPTDILVINNQTGLMGAIQNGSIEFHLWGSSINQLEQPDRLVFDLDPDESITPEQVRQGVRDLKSLLNELGLKAYLKTSGGKGYHVVVPLFPSADWESCASFAKLIAQGMESKWPDRYTANMRKNKRKDKIYIDWVRSRRSSTAISNFSLRARPSAPISWPLRWSDLDSYLPNSVNISNWKDHLHTLGGWDNYFQTEQKLK